MVWRDDTFAPDSTFHAEGQGWIFIPYPLHESPGYRPGLTPDFDQLELERRASTVDCKDPQSSDRRVRNLATDNGHRDRDTRYFVRRNLVGIVFEYDHVPQLAL